jgi:predicted acyl esterase
MNWAFWVCSDTRALSARNDVLVFQPPGDIEVSDPLTIKLWASSDALDTDLTAKLVDVSPPSAK